MPFPLWTAVISSRASSLLALSDPATPLAPRHQGVCSNERSCTSLWHPVELLWPGIKLDFVQEGLARLVQCISVNEPAATCSRPQQWMPTCRTQPAAPLLLPKHSPGARAGGSPRKPAQPGIFSLLRSLLQPVVSSNTADDAGFAPLTHPRLALIFAGSGEQWCHAWHQCQRWLHLPLQIMPGTFQVRSISNGQISHVLPYLLWNYVKDAPTPHRSGAAAAQKCWRCLLVSGPGAPSSEPPLPPPDLHASLALGINDPGAWIQGVTRFNLIILAYSLICIKKKT